MSEVLRRPIGWTPHELRDVPLALGAFDDSKKLVIHLSWLCIRNGDESPSCVPSHRGEVTVGMDLGGLALQLDLESRKEFLVSSANRDFAFYDI